MFYFLKASDKKNYSRDSCNEQLLLKISNCRNAVAKGFKQLKRSFVIDIHLQL